MARLRPIGPLLVVVALLLASIATARSAEPPPGVVFDGIVTVTVHEPDSAGGPGSPVAGATVVLAATVNDFPEGEIQRLEGTTDDAGTVEFADVARPDQGGPTVRLAAIAQREASTGDVDCVETISWYGLTEEVRAAPAVEIEVVASPASSVECRPKPVLRGSIRDATGRPIAEARVSVSLVALPDGPAQGFPTQAATGGAYGVELNRWGVPGAVATVTVRAISAATRDEAFGEDCLLTWAQDGSATKEIVLGEDEDLEAIDVVTEEVVVGERCGVVSPTARPPAPPPPKAPLTPRPRRTLPPTDTAGAGPEGGGSSSIPAIAVIVFVSAIAGGAAARRPSRPVR